MAARPIAKTKSYLYDFRKKQWNNRTNFIISINFIRNLSIEFVKWANLYAFITKSGKRVVILYANKNRFYVNNGSSFSLEQLADLPLTDPNFIELCTMDINLFA